MLVRDGGHAWQVVLQTDHADLSGQFVRAWSPRPEPFRSLEIVARRHDDGWAIWERAPGLDGEGRWRNYALLQVGDRLSLHFCLRDAEGGEAAEIAEYRLEPLGPWRISIDPFPFAESPAEVTPLRRLVTYPRWAGHHEVPRGFLPA